MIFRRRRHDVGTYEAPDESPEAPIDRVIEEGVLIAESSVRLMLRNRIVVGALRDRVDLDRDDLARAAAAALLEVADQEWESAQRLGFHPIDPFEDPEYSAERARRERLRRALSDALAARAEDADALAALVERARVEAWDEIGPYLETHLGEPVMRLDDAHYARDRADRLATFIALDLTELAVERGAELA
jgi:hypothetical protein